ncbi:hypothetical protein J8F10_10940 [Gemmata sp. G18]|uniref:Uncharacterized protein n=1 Tax=Gemmata palustris TaxID=2822762 RepID=A0ABS5BPX7_9BACT|nr:hypothetical protein [Gemmata palustris]MBP3955799.1 hypothetical protein [Gemmata palustris]
MTHALSRFGLASVALLCATALAPAQIKEPPRTEKVKLEVRYRIRADRDERVRQYLDLQKFLTKLGFEDARKNDPDYDLEILDPGAERFTGTIPSAKVLEVLNNPRVQNILFAPDGFVLPAEGDKPVAIKLGLRSDYTHSIQEQLHRQTVAHLANLGFVEALGYDTRDYTLVRGAISAKSVPLLVRDLRYEPSGWFVPLVRTEQLPSPLRDRNPVRWAEVLPVTEFAAPFAPTPVVPAQLRYSTDLRALAINPATKDAPIRVEVIFQDRVTDFDALKTLFEGRYSGSSIDGIIGNIVHVRLHRGAYIEPLSQEPGILGVRLPRQGAETIANTGTGKSTTAAEAIKAARIDELHKLGYTGAGVKIVLIGSDFTGADKLIGTELPKRTKIIDLTTELSPDLFPFKADPLRQGAGLAAAKALAAVALDVELVLVRIDPGCFFHLNSVIRLSRGDIQYTEALLVRLSELSNRTNMFDADRAKAVATYKSAYSDLSDNEVALAARKKAKADLEAFIPKEKELLALTNRFNAYQKDITTGLAGAQVIVNTLVWESGYPLDAISEFAGIVDRLATDLPPRIVKPLTPHKPPLVWVQAASAAGASVWGGPFLDANRDGLMEFVPPKTKLPADNWSPSLNFLGTRAADGAVAPDLAAGTKLRLVVQWREPADPSFPETDIPVHPLTLRVLRQIDPNGEKRSSDEMAEDARSVSVPNVIYRTPTFLVFEQMLEFTVPAAGRYALALESAAVPEPLLPALRREVEVFPRIVIETLGTKASDPKAVFRSYTAPTAGVGTPGDALGAITVGSDAPDALVGGGTGLTLRGKPDVLGPNSLTLGAQSASGPGIATAFAGGTAALLVQARTAGPNVIAATGLEPGKKLEIPEKWLKVVPSIARRRE